MKANLVAIKDCVVKAKTWNPVVEAKDETIKYIDIAAVDKDLKNCRTNIMFGLRSTFTSKTTCSNQ